MENVRYTILVIDVLMVVSVGIIGYQNHARNLIQLIEKNSKCELTTIYHPTKKINDHRITNNFDDLLKSDVIIIASPNDTHYMYLQKLKRFNGYIFCEKPPVTNIEELNQIENFSIEKKHKIFFNFNYRFSDLCKILKQYTQSEELGKILHISIISSHGFAFNPNYLNSWRSKNMHNILETLSIHYLDLLNYVVSDIGNFQYFPKNYSDKGSAYDTNHISGYSSNKMTVSILTSYSSCYLNEVLILGTNGYLVIRDDILKICSPRDSFDAEGLFTTPTTLSEKRFNLNLDYKNSLSSSINYFIDLVEKNENVDLNLYESSLNTCKIIFELENSIQ